MTRIATMPSPPAAAPETPQPFVDLPAVLDAALRAAGVYQSAAPIVVAVSGGSDSMALLGALHALAVRSGGMSPRPPRPAFRLHVAHLDHGLRAESVADAAFVARAAEELGLTASLGARDVAAMAAAEGEGLEGAARRARYAFLAAVARDVGATVVLTGHHRDDQAETVLMALIRGAGLDGLSAMAPRSPWPVDGETVARTEGRIEELPLLLRPLLAVSRQDVAAWRTAHGIEARPDPSNEDTSRLRNRIRHELLPDLAALNPRIAASLARTARVLGDDHALLHDVEDDAWRAAATIEVHADGAARSISLGLDGWTDRRAAMHRRLIRRAVARLGGDLRALGFAHVEAVRALADHAAGELREGTADRNAEGSADGNEVVRTASQPAVNAAQLQLPGGLRVAVDRQGLRIGRAVSRPAIPPPRLGPEPVALAMPGTTPLPGGWRIETAAGMRGQPPRGDAWSARLDADAVAAMGPGLAARGRRPGERFQPLGMGGRSKSLQDFFTDARVPAAERDGWPLVVAGERIVWIPGHRVDERARVHDATRRTLFLRAVPPPRLVR